MAIIFAKKCFFVSIFIIFIAVTLLLATLIGERYLPLKSLLATLDHYLIGRSLSISAIEANILWYIRLPHAIIGFLAGAGLALSSTVLQTILRNPLAEPYLLGINSGASFGMVLVILFGYTQPLLSLTLGAFIGGLAAFMFCLFLLYFLDESAFFLLLLGLALGQIFNGLATILLWRYGDIEVRGQLYDWFLGSLQNTGWPEVGFLASITAISFLIIFCYSHRLDALLLGQDNAQNFGIHLKKTITTLLLMVSFLSAALVSTVGMVSFVGLITPHIARIFVGPTHKKLCLLSSVLGGIFLSTADILSRSLIPGFPLPLSAITSLICAPIFIILLIRYQNYDSH